MIVQRLAVIGLGLIGGSLARALRAAGAVAHISGYDPNPSRRDDAQRLCVIDRVSDNPAAAVRDADLVVLAVPVLHTADALVECLPACKIDVVITDVGSTKTSVLDDVKRVCGQLPPWFVAAHPIARSEAFALRRVGAGEDDGARPGATRVAELRLDEDVAAHPGGFGRHPENPQDGRGIDTAGARWIESRELVRGGVLR